MPSKHKRKTDEARMYTEFFTGTFGWLLLMTVCAFAVIRAFHL